MWTQVPIQVLLRALEECPLYICWNDQDSTHLQSLGRLFYGESRQTGTDQHKIHRPMPTRAGQCFYVDAFTCGHRSACEYKYCDLPREGASQMIYCNFTKSKSSEEVTVTTLWSNSTWAVYDAVALFRTVHGCWTLDLAGHGHDIPWVTQTTKPFAIVVTMSGSMLITCHCN